MKNKVKIPKGYRLRRIGERIIRGDMWFCVDEWMLSGTMPRKTLTAQRQRSYGPYIRRKTKRAKR